MAGHSKFANIKHRKNAQDTKRAKIFTKLQREISVSAKMGPDPEFNPRLRNAILAAKSQNMPKDRIENTIKKAVNSDDVTNFQEIRYEGYGPAGVALVINSLTDNRNRTASDIRSSLTKSGGSLAETGSLSFLFDHIGCIKYPINIGKEEDILEFIMELEAKDLKTINDEYIIYTELNDFGKIQSSLTKKFSDPISAKLIWKAKILNDISSEDSKIKIQKLLDNLEDIDDVIDIFGNFKI